MSHKYDRLAHAIEAVLTELPPTGLAPAALQKGGLGAVLLARHLGHELCNCDKGADARGPNGDQYEYKTSFVNRFTFNFGGPRIGPSIRHRLQRTHGSITGVYCAAIGPGGISRIAYCPTTAVLDDLQVRCEKSKANTLTAVYTFEAFLRLPTSVDLSGPGLHG